MKFSHLIFVSALTLSAAFTVASVSQLSGVTTLNVNARRYARRYRYRRPRWVKRTRHKLRSVNKYGVWKHYWKHGRKHSYYYRYKSGYFHGNKWVSYHKFNRTRHLTKPTNRQKSVNYDSMNNSGYVGANNIEPVANNNDQQLVTINSGVQASLNQQSTQPSYDSQTNNQEPYQPNDKVQPTYAQELPVNEAQDTDQSTDTGNQSQRRVPYENNWEAEMSARTIQDINADRETNGVQPLTETVALDDVAQARAEQHPNGHYNSQGQVENGIVAQQLGQKPSGGYYAENLDACQTNIGIVTGTDSKHTPEAISAADWTEDDLMNHDADSNYGHRNNILDSGYQEVGVGVSTYTDQNGLKQYSLAEEFN